ncbi:MAG: DMT family transporter, partial [Bacteroidota bacterium]
ANASVSLVCMATVAFFTSLLEPLILRQKVKWFELLIGITIVPSMMLIANTLDYGMTIGLIVGLISALLASLFTTLNKKLISDVDPISITFLEMSSAFLFISIVLPFYFTQSPEAVFQPSAADWKYLLILGILCTTVGYVVGLRALRHLSAFTSNLTYNLEPVYGILLAIVILEENKELSAGFYWGAFIIIVSVLGYPFLRKRFEAPPSSSVSG